jgi:WD40 repeat protein
MGGSVHDLCLSQDGKQLLGAGDDGNVSLWDLETHEELARFAGHIGRVPTAVFVGPNRIASADTDGNVYFWTWPQGEGPVKGQAIGNPRRLHRGGVHRLRISENGERLLTASFDNTAQILSTQTGDPIGVPFEHQGGVKGVAFSKDGNILTACEDDGAREWRPAPGSLRGRPFGHDGGAEFLFTPDSKYVLVRSGKTASIRRTLTDESVGIPFEPGGSVFGFAVSRDESKFVTCGAGGRVQFWDAGMGTPFGEAAGQHRGGVWAVAVSRDGRQAVSGGLDGVVKLWDVQTGGVVRQLHAVQYAPIRGIAISPDGSRIAIASADKRAWIIGMRLREAPRELKGHTGSVKTVAFSGDSKLVATGSWDKSVIVWDAGTGRQVASPMQHDGPFWSAVAFSTDRRSIVAGCDDHTVRIWDIETARPIGPKLPHEAALRTAVFTDDDSQIITGTLAGTIRRWDVSRRRCREMLSGSNCGSRCERE